MANPTQRELNAMVSPSLLRRRRKVEGNLEEEEEEQEEEKAIRAERKEKGHNLLLFSFLVFFGE